MSFEVFLAVECFRYDGRAAADQSCDHSAGRDEGFPHLFRVLATSEPYSGMSFAHWSRDVAGRRNRNLRHISHSRRSVHTTRSDLLRKALGCVLLRRVVLRRFLRVGMTSAVVYVGERRCTSRERRFGSASATAAPAQRALSLSSAIARGFGCGFGWCRS